jgi:hypothetical protein
LLLSLVVIVAMAEIDASSVDTNKFSRHLGANSADNSSEKFNYCNSLEKEEAFECFRDMAAMASEENAVLVRKNTELVSKDAEFELVNKNMHVQSEEIARLRGLLETHASHGHQRVYHEKILESMDIVDQPPHGTLYSPPPPLFPCCKCLDSCVYASLINTNIVRHQLPSLSLKTDSGCGPFRQPPSDFFILCCPFEVFDKWENIFSLEAPQPKDLDTERSHPVADPLAHHQPQYRYIIHLKPPAPVECSFKFWTALTQFLVLFMNRNGNCNILVQS